MTSMATTLPLLGRRISSPPRRSSQCRDVSFDISHPSRTRTSLRTSGVTGASAGGTGSLHNKTQGNVPEVRLIPSLMSSEPQSYRINGRFQGVLLVSSLRANVQSRALGDPQVWGRTLENHTLEAQFTHLDTSFNLFIFFLLTWVQKNDPANASTLDGSRAEAQANVNTPRHWHIFHANVNIPDASLDTIRRFGYFHI